MCHTCGVGARPDHAPCLARGRAGGPTPRGRCPPDRRLWRRQRGAGVQRVVRQDRPSPAAREQTRQALLDYCEVDTLGVVRLLDRLRELAPE